MRIFSLAAAISIAAGAVSAEGADLPKQLTWTAYGTGSAGYNQ